MADHTNNVLQGQVALITGAGRGLGATMAEAFARAGATVAISDINVANVEAEAKRLSSLGLSVHGFEQDVTDEQRWQELIPEVIARCGSLDILVNNAGMEEVALFENCELESFQRIQAVNVDGTFLGIKHGIRAMKPGGLAGKGGCIINLSSIAGMSGYTGLGAYCTAKGAVRLMSKAAARECGELGYGIRVNSIHPGLILTEMGSHLLEGAVRIGLAEDMAAAEAGFSSLHPMGLGKPEDVANLALYIASPTSSWVTGSEHIVDGGSQA